MQQLQRLIEAKQKNLAKQTTNEAKSIPKLNVLTVPLNLEASGSVMAHQDPSLGKSKVPKDSSGVPVRAKSPKDSSSASASRKNRRRSRSHNKVEQGKDFLLNVMDNYI